MNRLPGYDPGTRRSELAAFLGLGAVSVALVAFAVNNAAQFAAARECIVDALTHPVAVIHTDPDPGTARVMTNLTSTQTTGVQGRCLEPCGRPKS